ncbi:MAG: hypothetical protein KGO96_10330 [Elusimicrobia bacterium]|nr:hypothetical protein [Elusimicrobiota bacterium]
MFGLFLCFSVQQRPCVRLMADMQMTNRQQCEHVIATMQRPVGDEYLVCAHKEVPAWTQN